MTSYHRDGKVGPWARDKLECLEKYLNAYTRILRRRDWCEGYLYVDAFAGAGRSEVRKAGSVSSAERLSFDISAFYANDEEELSYIDGSPRVALEIEHPFTRYIFIEKNQSRAAQLQNLKQEYSGRREIDVIPENGSAVLTRLVSDSSVNWHSQRAVTFLDPFGMQVPWGSLEDLACTGAIEVFLNFPVGTAIQRQLPKSGKFSDEQREMLSQYFGSPEWEDILYVARTDLFGERDVQKVERSGEQLVRWYRGRLRKLFGYASQPHLIRNSQGSHLYYLIFAGPNATGAKIASDIFLRQGTKISR